MSTDGPAPKKSRREHVDDNGEQEEDGEYDIDQHNGHSNDNQDEFREGAITRVQLYNFMTYDAATFYPGPRLNLVLGPNGTGKSSIVNAICIGLGGATKLLGRASDMKDYVKHGKQYGWVEIWLYKKTGDIQIRRTLYREKKRDEWHINGKPRRAKDVEEIIAKMNIQLDNLTQFLPQDKVVAFASLSPTQLLKETQEAVLDPKITELHKKLIELRNSHKGRYQNVENYRAMLQQLQEKNLRLGRDVEKFRKRQAFLDKVEQLEIKRGIVEFSQHQQRAKALQQEKKNAEQAFKEQENKLLPLQKKRKALENESASVEEEYKQTVTKLRSQNKKCDDLVGKIETMDSELKALESALESLKKRDKEREAKKRAAEKKLAELEKQLGQLQNPDAINAQIKKKTEELNELTDQMSDKQHQRSEVQSRIDDLNQQLSDVAGKLKDLQDLKQRRLATIERYANNTYKAYQWIEANKHRFDKTPLLLALHVNVPSAEHAKFLEQHCPNWLLTAFVVSSDKDDRTLQSELNENRKLGVSIVCTKERNIADDPRPAPLEDLKKYGITHYLDQTFGAPDIIKSAMQDMASITQVAVGTRDTIKVTDRIFSETNVSALFTPESQYVVSKSKYDPSVFSTRVTSVRAAKLFGPMDTSKSDELEQQKKKIQEDIHAEEVKLSQIKAEELQLQKQKQALTAEKHAMDQTKNRWKQVNTAITATKNEIARYARQETNQSEENDIKAQQVQKNKQRIATAIELCNEFEKLTEMVLQQDNISIQRIMFSRKFDAINAQEQEIQRELKRLKAEVDAADSRFQAAKATLLDLRNAVETAKAEYMKKHDKTMDELYQMLQEAPDTIDEIDREISRNQAEADAIAEVHHSAIEEYEKLQKQIEEKERELKQFEDELQNAENTIERYKNQWLPPLKACLAKVNETFRQYCTNIGIAGEVQLVENEDFDKYAIQIKVRFRDNEQLSALSAHRQSGGERSVTTILYLLSLQSLNKCPFRVVDEINQGMDPVNERKIFLQMLKSSAGPDVPQCFLITPKLLPDLVPDSDDITILFIYNGSWNLYQDERFDKLMYGKSASSSVA